MSARVNKQAVYMRTRQHLAVNWRYLLRGFWFIASAVLLAAVISYLQRPDVLPIKKIQALGTFNHVGEETLRSVVATSGRGGYFSVDVTNVQHAIEQLPWVASASVSRMWPDTLAINVTEQQAHAVWAKGGLVNQSGVVFFPVQSSYPVGLPVFDGPAGMERNMTENYRLAKQIISALQLEILRLHMDSRRAISLQLSNGIEVVLGRENMQNRLERFVRVYKKVLVSRANEIARIDMRYSNGLAVGWRHGRTDG